MWERLQAAVTRATAWALQLRLRTGRRGAFALSALSLLWGLISGILLRRDFAHSRQLVAYLALLVVASVLFRIWVEYARRLSARSNSLRGVRKFLLDKPHWVAGLAHFATQCAAQYISMFCIPLLLLAKAWTTLALALALAGVSLIDPLWLWAARRAWCMALVRSFAAVLATSFVWPVFFPTYLSAFYPALWLIAILSSLPGDLWLAPKRVSWRQGAPALLVAALCASEALMHRWVRVPLLSVWLSEPALGAGIEDHALSQTWGASEDPSVLAAASEDGAGVCCFTPIVSPSGVVAPVTHEWLVDGSVISRIQLSAIHGLGSGKDRAFRTFSCKHHLPPAATVHTLTCRVYLDDEVYLGKTEVVFH